MTDQYIEKQDQVYRIKGTRVALDSIIYKFQQGRSPEAIQDAFPALSLSQVYAAIAYYLDHRAELDAYLAHNEATEAEFSREIARLFPKGAALKARIKEDYGSVLLATRKPIKSRRPCGPKKKRLAERD